MKRILSCSVLLATMFLAGCGESLEQIRSRGITEFELGRIARAKILLKEVINQRPADPVALYYLGRVAEAEGYYEQACYYYQSCLDADPSRKLARKRLDAVQNKVGLAATELKFIPSSQTE